MLTVTKYGGNNYRLKVRFTRDKAQTEGTEPSGWNACVGDPKEVPGTLTVWRKVWLWQTQMTPPPPPATDLAFDPLANTVKGAFDDGFVKVVVRSLDTGTPYQQPFNYCGGPAGLVNWAHNSGTYPSTHPPPIHTPHHSGVDHIFWASTGNYILGVYCDHGDTTEHVHSFTAVGYIRTLKTRYSKTELKIQQTTIHEMGHNLGVFDHPDTSSDANVCTALESMHRTAMRYSCETRRWYEYIHYFSYDEINLLRQRIRDIYE